MKKVTATAQTVTGIAMRRAIVAALVLSTTACQTTELWQGDDVLVEARQVTLERSVVGVTENHRELQDRFDALERLYVDLVHHVRTQEDQLKQLEAQLANFKKDPEAEAALTRLRGQVQAMRQDVKKLEGRVFSVETTSHVAPMPTSTTTTAPTGTAEHGADTTVKAEEAAAAPTPVQEAAEEDLLKFGVHLSSYRTKDQVRSGWSGLSRAFGANLEGLTPKVYVQNQQGIGTFLRLIVGPVDTEEAAESICADIKKMAGEQYCKVTEYQGEPIG